MTANLPKTVFRLGENDVLYGAEGASRVPDLDRPQFAAPVVLSPAVIEAAMARGRRLRNEAMRHVFAGLGRFALRALRRAFQGARQAVRSKPGCAPRAPVIEATSARPSARIPERPKQDHADQEERQYRGHAGALAVGPDSDPADQRRADEGGRLARERVEPEHLGA